ncbi:MAG: hypothetical protein IJ419_06650 [Agathobacter sp.]|nr:hypothetical protein [Agathobacter sp.]
MLQSIQYGSGPPTYIYSNNVTGMSNGFFHVYASQMSGHDPRRENPNIKSSYKKRENNKEEHADYIRECYEKEYRENHLIGWK